MCGVGGVLLNRVGRDSLALPRRPGNEQSGGESGPSAARPAARSGKTQPNDTAFSDIFVSLNI